MLFFRINLTINVAHPVFLMHIQSLLSGYAPGAVLSIWFRPLKLTFSKSQSRTVSDLTYAGKIAISPVIVKKKQANRLHS